MDIDASAGELYDFVTLALRHMTSTGTGARDLSLTAASTLSALDRGGPQRLTALAVREGVSQPSMTQLVQRLEQRGLVERAPDPSDGRAALVSLTDAGRSAMRARRKANAARLAGLLEALPDSDVRRLTDAVAAVLPALHARAADLELETA